MLRYRSTRNEALIEGKDVRGLHCMAAVWFTFLSLLACCVLAWLGSFVIWRRRRLAQLGHCGQVAETACGPVEYSVVGSGPVILHFHAGAAGCDQTLALSWDLQADGFTVLTPSRPGYLRTPLSTGAAPEQAADAVAALLQLLELDRVVVMGTSGGGPTALQFAIRHPTIAVGLILQSAVSQ